MGLVSYSDDFHLRFQLRRDWRHGVYSVDFQFLLFLFVSGSLLFCGVFDGAPAGLIGSLALRRFWCILCSFFLGGGFGSVLNRLN